MPDTPGAYNRFFAYTERNRRMSGSYLFTLGITGLMMTSPSTADRKVAVQPVVQQPVAARTDTTSPVITHGPYLQLPSSTSMTIVWHTDQRCVSRVEFGLDDRFDRRAISSRHGLIDNDRVNHIIHLTGLEPGMTYRYRVVSKAFLGYERQHIVAWGDSIISAPFEFTTLDPGKESFSFSMVSDLHERADELATMIGSAAWQDIDFAIYNGDMIDDFMEYDQIFTGFLDVSVAGYATGKPFIFTRGNHEVRGRFARSIPDFIPLKNGRAYYSFDHGPVHFIVLDSGEDKEDGHRYYNSLVDFTRYREEQARWLTEDLQSESAQRARFRIVISHIPPRGADRYWAESVRKHFEPPVHEGGVDLWLSGHTHRLMRIDPTQGENNYYLLIGPTHAVTRVDVSPDELRVTVTDTDGERLEAFTIRR